VDLKRNAIQIKIGIAFFVSDLVGTLNFNRHAKLVSASPSLISIKHVDDILKSKRK